jgi:hypothetical protein
MQKKATGSLRIGGDRVMKLAEELYQSGYISYPRTETDTFDSGYDLMVRKFCICRIPDMCQSYSVLAIQPFDIIARLKDPQCSISILMLHLGLQSHFHEILTFSNSTLKIGASMKN